MKMLLPPLATLANDRNVSRLIFPELEALLEPTTELVFFCEVTCKLANMLDEPALLVALPLPKTRAQVAGVAGKISPTPLFANVGEVTRSSAELPRFNPY